MWKTWAASLNGIGIAASGANTCGSQPTPRRLTRLRSSLSSPILRTSRGASSNRTPLTVLVSPLCYDESALLPWSLVLNKKRKSPLIFVFSWSREGQGVAVVTPPPARRCYERGTGFCPPPLSLMGKVKPTCLSFPISRLATSCPARRHSTAQRRSLRRLPSRDGRVTATIRA